MLSALILTASFLSATPSPNVGAECSFISKVVVECVGSAGVNGKSGLTPQEKKPVGNAPEAVSCRTVAVYPQPANTDPIWQGSTSGTIVNEVCDRLPGTGAFVPNAPGTPFWVPQVVAVDPAVLARQLLATLQIRAIDIGMVPEEGSDRLGAVGVPVWLWVDQPTPQTVGPLTASQTISGVTVSLTATLASVDWDMGDGTVVRCTGPDAAGTPYTDTDDLTPSPTCGHTYTKQGNPYTITATAHWQVDWTAAGQSGTIPLDLTSTTTRRIGELQVLSIR